MESAAVSGPAGVAEATEAVTIQAESPTNEPVIDPPFVRELSKSPSRGQMKCVVS